MVQPTESSVQSDENGFALSYGWIQVYCVNTISREYIGKKLERTFIGVTLFAGS
ncbi:MULTISPECIES: hypothetical protein [Xenorhabdus]|uniref:hypothetical protein n=1 Tax=Xenorhabdus TaxID=626 RepID=UPI000AAD3D47|nr:MULTISPECIES: hypothetical protein [Xenorhabdus]